MEESNLASEIQIKDEVVEEVERYDLAGGEVVDKLIQHAASQQSTISEDAMKDEQVQ